MRILLSESGALRVMGEDGPLRRESLQLEPLSPSRDPLDWPEREEGPDLVVLDAEADRELASKLRDTGVPVMAISGPEEVGPALEQAGMQFREELRVPVHIPAEIARGTGQRTGGITRDLSRSGAFLCCQPEKIRAGEGVRVRLEGREPLELGATVVRVCLGGGYRVPGLGVRFDALDRERLQALDSILDGPCSTPRIPFLQYPS